MNDLIVDKLSSANRLLTEAKTVQQAKVVIDIAYAAEVYAKRQQLGEEAIGYAHEIKVYALRKLGEMLKLTAKNKGAKGSIVTSSGQEQVRDNTPTLADHGLNGAEGRKVSMLAQQIADLPLDKLEAVAKRVQSITQVQRESRAEAIQKKVSLPNAKYRVIYADPPWSYGNNMPEGTTEQRDYYPVMSLTAICEIAVNAICEDNAVLFLWVTSPILEESFQVIKAWGFKYKTSFVWDKVKHNMGHYNSVRHEFLLVCTRGSGIPDVPKLFDSVVTEERTEHSVKPKVFYEIIETLYPHGKKLELFSRDIRAGWDSYGFEAASELQG